MKGFPAWVRRGALIFIAIACVLTVGSATAAPRVANGPRVAHLEVGQALRPGAVRSRAETTSAYCAAEISRWEYVECPTLAPPGAEFENTSREDAGFTLSHCPPEDRLFGEESCYLVGHDSLTLAEPGEKGQLAIGPGEIVTMEGRDLFDAEPVAASIVTPPASAALAQSTLRRQGGAGAEERQGAALEELRAREARANTAIDRLNRRRATPAGVRPRVAAARRSAVSLRRLLEADRPRTRKGEKAKAALLAALDDEAGACRELASALGGTAARQSIGHANRDLGQAASEARAAVRIVTGR